MTDIKEEIEAHSDVEDDDVWERKHQLDHPDDADYADDFEEYDSSEVKK